MKMVFLTLMAAEVTCGRRPASNSFSHLPLTSGIISIMRWCGDHLATEENGMMRVVFLVSAFKVNFLGCFFAARSASIVYIRRQRSARMRSAAKRRI